MLNINSYNNGVSHEEKQKMIGSHKTTVFTDSDNFTRVVFHNTTVVGFDSETIVLNTGGWETPTTKKRMNQTADQFNLGFRVFQKNWVWFVEFKGEVKEFTSNTLILNR